jgi:hypothetical protein
MSQYNSKTVHWIKGTVRFPLEKGSFYVLWLLLLCFYHLKNEGSVSHGEIKPDPETTQIFPQPEMHVCCMLQIYALQLKVWDRNGNYRANTIWQVIQEEMRNWGLGILENSLKKKYCNRNLEPMQERNGMGKNSTLKAPDKHIAQVFSTWNLVNMFTRSRGLKKKKKGRKKISKIVTTNKIHYYTYQNLWERREMIVRAKKASRQAYLPSYRWNPFKIRWSSL